MSKMTVYTVRYKQLVDKDQTAVDEVLVDSPCEAHNFIMKLLQSPHLLSYKIIKEEELSLKELETEITDALEIIKKD